MSNQENPPGNDPFGNVPDKIPLTPELRKQLRILPGGKRDQEIKELSDGSKYRVMPDGAYRKIQEGTKETSWVDRAKKAEQYVVLLVRERDTLRDRILEACLCIRKMNFKMPDGDLNDFPAFQTIERFARGVPGEQGIPLRELPLDGKREVRRIHCGDYVLSCGHIRHYQDADENKPKLRDSISCAICTDMLKERGWYQEKA